MRTWQHRDAADRVPSAVEHATSFHGATSAVALSLPNDTIAEIADLVGERRSFLDAKILPQPAPLLALGRAVHRELECTDAGNLLAAGALTQAIIVSLLRVVDTGDGRATATRRGIRAAIDRIHSAYAEDITLAALAKASGMGRFHFSHRFSAEVGVPPYQYLVGVRLQRAAELLRRGHHSFRLTNSNICVPSPGFPTLCGRA